MLNIKGRGYLCQQYVEELRYQIGTVVFNRNVCCIKGTSDRMGNRICEFIYEISDSLLNLVKTIHVPKGLSVSFTYNGYHQHHFYVSQADGTFSYSFKEDSFDDTLLGDYEDLESYEGRLVISERR